MLTSLFTVQEDDPVGVGIRDACFGSLGVVVKEAGIEETYSEFIASRLGPMFGVNTVPGIPQSMSSVHRARWLSTRIGDVQGPLPEGHRDDWDKDIAQVRGFDLIIGMTDRHTQNYTKINGTYYIFDHGLSMGWLDEGLRRDEIRRLKDISRTFPLAARSLSSRAHGLSSEFLNLLSDEFELFVPEAKKNNLYKRRRGQVVTLLPQRAKEAASALADPKGI